jgi:hypothetical protein
MGSRKSKNVLSDFHAFLEDALVIRDDNEPLRFSCWLGSHGPFDLRKRSDVSSDGTGGESEERRHVYEERRKSHREGFGILSIRLSAVRRHGWECEVGWDCPYSLKPDIGGRGGLFFRSCIRHLH